jgi:hypothetical protein
MHLEQPATTAKHAAMGCAATTKHVMTPLRIIVVATEMGQPAPTASSVIQVSMATGLCLQAENTTAKPATTIIVQDTIRPI